MQYGNESAVKCTILNKYVTIKQTDRAWFSGHETILAAIKGANQLFMKKNNKHETILLQVQLIFT